MLNYLNGIVSKLWNLMCKMKVCRLPMATWKHAAPGGALSPICLYPEFSFVEPVNDIIIPFSEARVVGQQRAETLQHLVNTVAAKSYLASDFAHAATQTVIEQKVRDYFTGVGDLAPSALRSQLLFGDVIATAHNLDDKFLRNHYSLVYIWLLLLSPRVMRNLFSTGVAW